MKRPWRRRWHQCARALSWTAGVAIIALALLIALAQLFLPLLGRHPQWVEAQLSQRLHRPITFASIQGQWQASGPLFVMHGITVGPASDEGGATLHVPEAELKLDFSGLLVPARHVLTLRVSNLQLDVTHAADGSWRVNSLGDAGSTSQQKISFGRLSLDLQLDHLQIAINDVPLNHRYTVLAPALRLSHQGRYIRFGGTLQRRGVTGLLHTAGRFRDDGSAGRIWLGADQVQLEPLLDGVDMGGYKADGGQGQLAVWLDWRNGRLGSSVIRFDLDQLTLASPAGATATVAALHGIAGLKPTPDGYDVRWAGDDGSALAISLHHAATPQASVAVAARELQLAPLLPWLALKPDMSAALADWLGSGHPHGDLSRVALHWSKADGIRSLDVTFRDVGVDPVGKLPGVNHLHGDVRGDAEALSLLLPPQPATLNFPKLFRQPLVLTRIGGTFALWAEQGDWHIGADTLSFTGAGYAGQARGDVALPAQGGAPLMDMYVSMDHFDLLAAKLFWPIGSMSQGTIDWLNRALVGGQIKHAQLLVHGNLADWPFRHNEGRFEARVPLNDLELDYDSGWPHAKDVSAVANFINNGMRVQLNAGQSLGVKINSATALIPDFAQGLLDINVQGSSSGASLLNFVSKSPIGIKQADTLAKLQLGGTDNFNFHLSLPLKKVEDAELKGTLQLDHADLNAPDFNLALGQITGPLQFDLHGIQASALTTVLQGEPSILQLAIGGANTDPNTDFSARLQGEYTFAELLQGFPSLKWISQLADGRSTFNIGFAVAGVPGSGAVTQTLQVDSSLAGIALKLPAPLDKPSVARMPLHLSMSLPAANSDIRLSLGDALSGYIRLPADTTQPLEATLALGSQMPTILPSTGIRVRGHASVLDVSGWTQWVAGGAGAGGPALESLDVSADRALLFGTSLGALHISGKPQTDALNLNVDGPALSGNIMVPTKDMSRRGITAKLQRLYWPKAATVKSSAKAFPEASPANATGTTMAANKSAPPVADPAYTGITPSALPPLHLLIGELRLDDAKLGEARLETWPTGKGLHIEQLRALSSRVQINASGDWNGSATDSQTHMRISFDADDLGAMLSTFGYEGLVHGGKTHDQLDATWPGAPTSLSLADMDGSLDIHVSDGRIPEATPGVGRLLGLVSLAELPRRLTLDFGDVFGKGLGFDSIKGTFQLAHGNATTEDLAIKGPAANINISGRTGLRARDFDQQVVVVPHVGNSLPLVGAVVGGPIGAAAGFAVQGLLGKGLNKTASARYKVTGSWDKPVMTLIEKHGRMKPASPSPALPASSTSVAEPLPNQ